MYVRIFAFSIIKQVVFVNTDATVARAEETLPAETPTPRERVIQIRMNPVWLPGEVFFFMKD